MYLVVIRNRLTQNIHISVVKKAIPSLRKQVHKGRDLVCVYFTMWGINYFNKKITSFRRFR